MLLVEIPDRELFNEETYEFTQLKGCKFQIEHSLVSLSKWEQKWGKPFLGKGEKSKEELIDYIRCMTITQNVSPETYWYIPDKVISQINEYIDAPMTATWISEENSSGNRDIITAEIIYYWMIAQNIPMECQKWHLNRLLTLIRVCSIKNAPPKKTNKKTAAARRASINKARREQLNTKG